MKKTLLIWVMAVAMGAALLSGCGGRSSAASDKGVVVLRYPTFQCGVDTAAPVVERLIREFNELHAGQYEIQKEDVPGIANYVDKIKLQMSNGSLPPVVYGGGYNLLDLALGNDLVVHLTDEINADPAWKALYGEATMAANSRNGRIYASSSEGSLVGYFYNKELFAQAGIQKPADTWEEFFRQCEQLKTAGITPLALDTADSAWVTQLWWGAMLATGSEAGLEFMRQRMPDEYQMPEMLTAVVQVQRLLQTYTTVDAVGGKYENAANNFLSGEAAMIANGPWMMNDFSDLSKTTEGFADKVDVAIFPGSFVYDAPIQGYFVIKQQDPKIEAAAVEMVRFFTSAHAQQVALEMQAMVPSAPAVKITAAVRETYPLLAKLLEEAANATYRSDNMQSTMWPNLLDVVSRELPALASGEITPETFCQIMTYNAAKNH